MMITTIIAHLTCFDFTRNCLIFSPPTVTANTCNISAVVYYPHPLSIQINVELRSILLEVVLQFRNKRQLLYNTVVYL